MAHQFAQIDRQRLSHPGGKRHEGRVDGVRWATPSNGSAAAVDSTPASFSRNCGSEIVSLVCSHSTERAPRIADCETESFDTQHTEALYTQKKSQFYLSFWRSTLISCERVATGTRNRNFTSVFGDRPSFRAKGLQREPGNRNFTSVFGDRTSFRAKRSRRISWNRNFTSVFDDRTSFFVRKGCAGHLQIVILLQFLAIEARFARKGCAEHLQIAILLQFLAIEPHFVRKGCVSCRLVGTAPAPAFRREIEKKERARGARGRGQEGKRRRCEDVRMRRCEEEGKRARGQEEKMWGCEDVRMRRCEDVKMWGWEDVKMSRCEDVKMSRCEDEQMWRWADVKMRRCEDEKMWRWEDVKMRRCEDEKMWRWGMRWCKEEKMWRCEEEKMWRWADVKMSRCEDEKMRRWEDVMMRRCFTDPHYWKNPALRRSRGKKQTKIHHQALPCTNWFHLVPNWFLPGSYRFYSSVPTNLKWFPNCSHAHALFQDSFEDVQVGSRWLSTLYILSPLLGQ